MRFAMPRRISYAAAGARTFPFCVRPEGVMRVSRRRAVSTAAMIGLIAMLAHRAAQSDAGVERSPWGETPDGTPATLYTLRGTGVTDGEADRLTAPG